MVKENNTLKLTSKFGNSGTSFALLPQTPTPDKEIRFGVILSIQNSKELVKVNYQEELTSLNDQKNKDEYQLSFVKSKKDYSTVAFSLEDVAEVTTAHVYKLSLMFPKLIDGYFYLKDIDLSQKTLANNQDKEGSLKQTCEQLKFMFENIRKVVIQSNVTEVDIIKRQSSMREMGVIDALIKLADLVQYKLQSSENAPILERDTSKFSYKSAGDETNPANQLLYSLEENIYQLIYDSIKNNPKNCKSLMEYEDRIVPMLTSRSFKKIGKILREMFKFVEELSKYSENRIKKWFDYLKLLKLSTCNIQNQSMYLSMMKYLCTADGIPYVNYQAQFKDRIFTKENPTKIIKLHIFDDKPCIELDYNRNEETLQEILYHNTFLSSLKLIKLNDLLELDSNCAIFYLEDLSKEKEYTKYISSAVDFYSSLCVGRYTPAIEKIVNDLYATPEYFLLVLDSKIDFKLKASFIEFLTIVLLDVDPYVKISHFKPRCYS